jgi:hypothetical protein
MVKVFKIFLVSLLIFCAELAAQPVSALASVDSSDYLVGDYINYTLEIRAEKTLEIIAPLVRDSLKEIEIINELEPSIVETEDSKLIIYEFTISYYDSGSVTISPIPIQFKTSGNDEQTVLSNSVTFTVHTIPVDQQAEIKDVKEPLTIPLDWGIIILIALIALIVIVIAVYFYLRRKKKKAALPVKKKIIKIPAHVKALTALDELKSEQLWQKGKVKEYHSKITGIVRSYFEERFNLPALELTTTEQMQQLKNVYAAEIILDKTNQFLNNADLVKFAKFIPIPSLNEEMMVQAKDIVNKTIQKDSETVQEEVQNV